MATPQPRLIFRQLHKVLGLRPAGGAGDAELLRRFALARDEAAFELLLWRHGGMVLRVCRHVLRDRQLAEDAFQATFLVLARKASAIGRGEAVGAWLHRVAHRIALRARTRAQRSPRQEFDLTILPAPAGCEPADAELHALVHHEVERLPAKYRTPIILCYFEALTHEEAAQRLGWPRGTVAGRLARARELLRQRLLRRGVALTAVGLGTALIEPVRTAAAGGPLVETTLRGAIGFASGQSAAASLHSARAAAWAEGALKTMFWNKLKSFAVVVLAAGLACAGAATLLQGAQREPRALQDGARADDNDPSAGRQGARDPRDLARQQAESRDNLKNLALAMHNYLDANQHFPPPALYAGQVEKGMGRPGVGDPRGTPAGPDPFGGARPASGGVPEATPPGTRPPDIGPGPGSSGSSGPGDGAGPRDPNQSSGGGTPPGPGVGSASGPGAGIGNPGGDNRGSGVGQGPAAGKGAGAGGPQPGGGPFPGAGDEMRAGIGGRPARPGGAALLSWRVALLPYLGEEKLYQQFHLNEAWDSPHNKQLLKKMPRVYAPPGGQTREPYTTYYQVFVGPHAAFEKHQGLRITSFTDGTSNTLLIAEAAHPVPWTKPEDLHYAGDEPLPEVGGLFPTIFHAAFADGSVHALPKTIEPAILRALITRDQGEVVDFDRIQTATGDRGSLLRQNEELRQALEANRLRVEELRRLKESIQRGGEDPALEKLRKENLELRDLLHQTQLEGARLEEEIRKLRPGTEKPVRDPTKPRQY